MINPTLYNRSVDVLLDAYFKDMLQHGSCCACAVGNLIAAAKGYRYDSLRRWKSAAHMWDGVFTTVNGCQRLRPGQYIDAAKDQIDSTGYPWRELAKIEFAFETAPKGKSDDEWMFNGLMAVIDVLDEIHQNTDTEVTQQSKQKFIKV